MSVAMQNVCVGQDKANSTPPIVTGSDQAVPSYSVAYTSLERLGLTAQQTVADAHETAPRLASPPLLQVVVLVVVEQLDDQLPLLKEATQLPVARQELAEAHEIASKSAGSYAFGAAAMLCAVDQPDPL
ncbi:MAG: hypothetical protein ACLP8S_04190 [Solirubrobacteraceae bacterium]